MSDRQALLEAQRNQPIREIVAEALERHKGEKSAVQRASIDLDVTDATLYNWCRELELDLNHYR